MKFQITYYQELGNEIVPCYEVIIHQIPNLLERIFGIKKEKFKCISDLGLEWFKLPNFERVKFNSKLDKELTKIPLEKRREYVIKLFKIVREVQTTITESRKSN